MNWKTIKTQKRVLAWLLTVLLAVTTAVPAFAAFDPEARISTAHIVLLEADTGTVLFEKDADTRAYPASTTKIMTCILALENSNLDDEVTVGEEVWRGFGSQSSLMKLSEGEKVTMRDLIYGIMMVSGNDAAAAIAVHIGGSIDGFADMMNAKAQALGMTNTHFVNPHGKHDENHYTTARDMSKLAAYAMHNQQFREIVSHRYYDVPPTNKDSDGYHLENSNKLVHTKEDNDSYEYRYAIGIKTGDTNAALRCLVAAAEKDGVTLISVQLRDEDNNYRFSLAADLFDWGFSKFTSVAASTLSLPDTVQVPVKNCSFDDAEGGLLTLSVDLSDQVIAGTADWIDTVKANVAAVTTTVNTEGEIAAPVHNGDAVATVTYSYEGTTLFTANATATRDVMEMGAAAAATTTPASDLVEDIQKEEKSAGPWLFFGLIAALIIGAVIIFKVVANNKRRRRTSRTRRRPGSRGYRR
ncbi:MAG: D-alanyl-D-alanine carboxypeptidase [Eubacteriales bacterium]|nr:D-alanyl-D-alanine carboxypeptidase [Eubacteriales bacterium]